MTIGERFGHLWDRVRHAARQEPATVRIPADHVVGAPPVTTKPTSGTDSESNQFTANEHYFQVRVNELFLVNQRDWFTVYDPIVVTSTEFLYGDKPVLLPFVVGPSMMRNGGSAIPAGMRFTNTSVAGPHPYRGGALKLSLILGKLEREDYARKYLGWIENATKIFDYATALGSYMKVATLILDGVEAVLGTDGDKMLIGLRTEIDPDAGDDLSAGYYALIDAPGVKGSELWVVDHQLYHGATAAQAKQFRAANYVLYSITRAGDRTDVPQLPFYSQYQRVIELAMQSSTDAQWKVAKASMATLSQALRQSPDLTTPHGERLRERYTADMVEERQKAIDLSTLHYPTKLDSEMRNALQILEL
jgi:hypothetical protein